MKFNKEFGCLIICLALFSACNEPEEKVAEIGEPLPVLEKVNMFIETSSSMGGYFQKDAAFKTVLSDLTIKIHNNITPVSIFFIGENTVPYSHEINRFSSDIATTRIARDKSSEIHKIVEEIAEKTDSTAVSLFVSDFILSFPDEDIRKNPEINRYEAPNALKNNIFNTFSVMNKSGFNASIYAFTSNFYGDYFDYGNRKTTLNGTTRPYYILVLGKKHLLDKFNEQLKDINTFKPEQYLHFGAMDEAIRDYEIFTQVGRSGEWSVDGNSIKGINRSSEEGSQFTLGFDLSSLPSYVQEEEYLSQNLQVDCEGCNVSFEIMEKEDISDKPTRKREIEALEKNTHLIVINVEEMALGTANLNLKLPLRFDNWYLDWSTDDDRNITDMGHKTFALEHMINGIREVYENNNTYFIESEIQLNQ